MRFEHVILMIIAFNVVSAVLQRRAKKRAEAAEAEQAAGSVDPWAEADELQEEWGEQRRVPSRERDGRERGGRRVEASQAPDGDEVERLPSFGRDILDQLARDLGLKVPRPQAPAPKAPPSSSTPSTPPTHPSRGVPREVSPPHPVLREERAEVSRTVSFPERPREVSGERRERADRVRPAPVARPVRATLPAAVSAVSALDTQHDAPVRRPELHDRARLREAFVLKEILDAPRARRPQRTHRF